MKYQSRADLLIAAGESIKMQTAAGIEPMQKYGGSVIPIIVEGKFHIGDKLGLNEFPLSVVEGKPVFRGDELYDKKGGKIKLEGHEHLNYSCFSWSPPKPKTVMVEMIVEDAATMLGVIEIYQEYCQSKESAKRVYGCLDKALKALEKA